ncbi:vWA domain-containing protein [Ramlibacter sp.]|uniref:vWA domain-containing protein n=1 Tax=Ramlibacter sp. TaxID=1917967 RepID=UPI003D09AA82
MQLGDARTGKLADNIAGFGRTLRRAGVRIDSSRIALAQEAARWLDIGRREDVSAAFEAVMISREQDRAVFRELFDAYFRDPELAHKLLAQLLPAAESKGEARKRRPRVNDALSPQRAFGGQAARPKEEEIQRDAAMTASEVERLKHADFNSLGAGEYRLVERLARDVPLAVPTFAARRSRPGARGAQLHWSRTLRQASRTGGELLLLRRLERRKESLPLLVLVDVSGSMERYARLLLAFLHAATREVRRRDVFAFGTHLTDLTPAFKLADTDAMLAASAEAIRDYAGGTRLGESLRTLRELHARRLVGRRTLVLIVSDGLDTGEPELLSRELAWLVRRSRRLLWLNPLLRFDAYSPVARGAAVLHRHAHGMLAVHNLARLQELAAGLAAVMKT